MDFDLAKAFRNAANIKLPGGVVGKVCTVLTVTTICIAGLGMLSRNEWIMAAGIGAIGLIVFPLLWRVINFADRNPQAALLEGAQFLVHQQMVLGTKQNPVLVVAPETFAEEQLIEAEVAEPPMLPNDPEEVSEVAPAGGETEAGHE